MDDGPIFTKNMHDMEQLIFRIQNICIKYGLQLNKSKCKILSFNVKDKLETCSGIEIVQKKKSLGILIDNKRKCFESYKQKKIEDGLKFSNILYSFLGNSVNRLLVGKTYWKGAVLPNIMYGSDVINYNASELSKIQVVENKAYRLILQVPYYTANSFLRGEIGASSSKSRDMKNKILFLKHCFKTDTNSLLNDIITKDFENELTPWLKTVKSYLKDLKLALNDVLFLSDQLITDKIYAEDSKLWRQDIESKVTLNLYRNKLEISEIKWFRNHPKYYIMMRARSNTLDLEWRNRNTNENKTCKLCNLEIETLSHFLLNCYILQDIRNSCSPFQLPRIENDLELLKELLLFENKYGIKPHFYIDLLCNLWQAGTNFLKLEDASFYGF